MICVSFSPRTRGANQWARQVRAPNPGVQVKVGRWVAKARETWSGSFAQDRPTMRPTHTLSCVVSDENINFFTQNISFFIVGHVEHL